MEQTVTKRRVVVAYDGSSCADQAIEWASELANNTGSTLEVVTVWQWPMTFGYPVDVGDWKPEADALRVAERGAARADLRTGEVRTFALEGPTGPRLVGFSRGAHALVVGTRGHHEIGGILLGSVSSFCAHHAETTVVVVRRDVSSG